MVQSTEARARPFALPASFCWPPARADTARRDSKRASSSPGVKESVKERFDATWPVARSDLCSWRPCVEERFFAPEDSFKVFNYTMASEPEVPVPATEPGTRFRGRDVRVSPWTILSRRPQDSIGALKGQRMSYQQRVEVPEKSRSFEVRMPQVRAESPASEPPGPERDGWAG
ncbi:unnamed protein product [Effrenium voratum]|uniref:Uncharacterized protein n=1 Tax=Effrenium voratum TaxID=2562239 RepID=A0AA36JT06_9DINO|nr:unnamed protein product [Effrenium voratum]